MEILLTNDDSFAAKGIRVLAEELQQLGHVTVIAPQFPQSGQSNAISVQKVITLDPVKDSGTLELWNSGTSVFTTSGTPSDCVKLALNAGIMPRPDLIVSGINHGSNAAINTIYSGTMGACFVAAENGIPAIGFSICDHLPDADFEHLRPYILPICKQLLALPTPSGTCYNVNAPKGEIKGIRITRQANGHWTDELQRHTFPNGQPFFILQGEFINREPDCEDTDEWALANGYLSITPQTIDLTNHNWLEEMKQYATFG